MKVDRSQRAAMNGAAKSEFKQVLKAAPPGMKPKVVPLAAGAHARTVQTLSTARTEINVRAERLAHVRAEGQTEQDAKLDSRLVDLICKELRIEFGGDPRAAN